MNTRLLVSLTLVCGCAENGTVRTVTLPQISIRSDVQLEMSANGLSPDLEKMSKYLTQDQAQLSDAGGDQEGLDANNRISRCLSQPDVLWQHLIVLTNPDGTQSDVRIERAAVTRAQQNPSPTTFWLHRLLGGYSFGEENYLASVDERGDITPGPLEFSDDPPPPVVGHSQTIRYPLPSELGTGTVVETRTTVVERGPLEIEQACAPAFSGLSGL